MAVVDELIRKESDGTLSFGNYELPAKKKLDNFSSGGDIYKVKTFNEITKLEKNGLFVYESVPGTTVYNLKQEPEQISFEVEGPKDAQITLEMEAEKEYEIFINENSAGKIKTTLGGKITFGVELDGESRIKVRVAK